MLGEFLLALILGLLVASILASFMGYRGRRGQSAGGAFLFFFLIAFFFVMAAGAWAQPYGPALYGVFWAPFLFWAIIVGLILAAVGASDDTTTGRSSAKPKRRHEAEERRSAEMATSAFGMFFFALLILLGLAVLIGAVD